MLPWGKAPGGALSPRGLASGSLIVLLAAAAVTLFIGPSKGCFSAPALSCSPPTLRGQGCTPGDEQQGGPRRASRPVKGTLFYTGRLNLDRLFL
ncbi:hypothetical protein SAT01_17150 [Sinomonas atrocyanea]|nr:hypothetical protein SAT01_17150 [Sinomonas atrocyanea]GGG57752.1 hypothetical protein GCM10007172_05760 [Sinomonas atrocyanea]